MNRRKRSKIQILLEVLSYLLRKCWGLAVSLAMAASRRPWVCGSVLVAAVLVAYGPAWGAGFVWDDDVSVTRNPLLTASNGLLKIWFSLDSPSQYFPLTYTTFYIEHALWGLNPAGYHLVNLLLHAANALVVWRLLLELRVPGAWLAAAIFALHPAQVESAAWIAERKNVLMGLFFLLTLWEWIKFVDGKQGAPRRFYVLALVFYFLALSAKTTACTLPVALLLILWFKKIPIDSRRLGQVAPFAGMAAGMGLMALLWERHQQGAQAPLFSLGLVERLLVASRALWFYLGKLVCPVNLAFSYPHWSISASDALAYGWVAATIALGATIWWARQRAGRSVEVAALFFVLTLSPLLGFIIVYTFSFSFVADHYQYLACIGPIALAAAGVALGLGRVKWGRPLLRPVVCAGLLVTLGVLTWRQCGTYADAETLWRATLDRNPGSWLAQTNLGTILLDEGDLDGAIDCFQKALAIEPGRPKTHDNLGMALVRKGEIDQAISEYQKALAIDPNMAKAHDNLGLALLKKGEVDEAIAHFQKALQIEPHIADAQNNLAIALANQGKPQEAIAHFQKAVESNPNDADARSNLGMALAQNGQAKEAMVQFQKILEINPDQMQACNNLAWLLATAPDVSLRDGARAVTLAQHANDLSGGENVVVLHTLSSAHAEAKNYPDAISTAKRALELAVQQKNDVLERKLRSELKLYETGAPPREGITPRSLMQQP